MFVVVDALLQDLDFGFGGLQLPAAVRAELGVVRDIPTAVGALLRLAIHP